MGAGHALAEVPWVWIECVCYHDDEMSAWLWGAHHTSSPSFPLRDAAQPQSDGDGINVCPRRYSTSSAVPPLPSLYAALTLH